MTTKLFSKIKIILHNWIVAIVFFFCLALILPDGAEAARDRNSKSGNAKRVASIFDFDFRVVDDGLVQQQQQQQQQQQPDLHELQSGVVQLSDFHRDLTEFEDEEDEAEVEAADTKRGRSNKKRRRRKEWSDDDDDDDDEEDNGSSTGAIVGISISVVILLAAVVFILIFKKRLSASAPYEPKEI